MTSKLGVYWSVMHRRPQDYDYFKRLQPSVFKIMDGGPNDYEWARANLPNSLIIARDWAMSEQHEDMLKDPVGTGRRHADEWSHHATRLGFDRTETLILGINEPRIWEPGVPEALRLYTIAMCERATALALRVGAMQLSVGWPNNNGPDTPPNWSAFHGVDNAIRANDGALVGHEYWADNGPGENWGWWGGRILKCPWQVPIVIGECGIDMYVKDGSVERHKRGWRGRKSPEQYAPELADYTGRMSADSRFVGNAVFAADYASQDWFSFDIEPAYQAILATPIPAPPSSTKPTTPAYIIAPAGANLRTAPITGQVIIAIPYAEEIRILGVMDTSGWLKVAYGDQEGYMAASLVGLVAPEPLPAPVHEVGPKPVEPPSGDNWARSRAFVRRWEGGFQDFDWDIGNWTGCEVGKGEKKGTKYGISACSYPNLDIKNITMEQADAIYFKDYWQRSGADKLAWPYCLIVFDTAVLHGVGVAQTWLAQVGNDPYAFAAKRLKSYTKSKNWGNAGAGWTNRVAELLQEASNE